MTKHAPHRSVHSFGTWMLCVVGLTGCERQIAHDTPSPEAERFASEVCAASYDCGCATRFESRQECVDLFGSRFTSAQRELALDLECFDSFVNGPVLSDCAMPEDLSPTGFCTALRGAKKEGESCSPRYDLFSLPGLVNECEDGLVCIAGECMRTPGSLGKQAGEPCNPSDPASCDPFTGVFCGNDGICKNGAGLGEPCTSPFGCYDPEAFVYCRLDGGNAGSCVETGKVGDACDPTERRPCVDIRADLSIGAAWCDASTRTCVEGHGPSVCESVAHPLAWPG
jgi:hypothetical protein